MKAKIIPFPTRQCDSHAEGLVLSRRMIRNALLLAIGFWSLAGLILLWWTRSE